MQDPFPPCSCQAKEQFLFHLSLGRRIWAFATPPLHGHDGGSVCESSQHDCCPFHPSDHNRWSTELIEEARFELAQAFGLAGTNCAQPLHFLAFCFFEDTAVPDAQRLALLLFQLLKPLVGTVPQKLLDEHTPPLV